MSGTILHTANTSDATGQVSAALFDIQSAAERQLLCVGIEGAGGFEKSTLTEEPLRFHLVRPDKCDSPGSVSSDEHRFHKVV